MRGDARNVRYLIFYYKSENISIKYPARSKKIL